MAEKMAVVENFLTCAVCLETFKEPVSLSCNHSFCHSCLQNFWETNSSRSCPVCRRRSSKERLQVNFALKHLSLSFTEEQKCERQTRVSGACSKHPEVPPLFCRDEQQLLCPVCDYFVHKEHTVVTQETAQRELKLQSELQALREERERVKAEETNHREMCEHAERQAQRCERVIRAQFQRMQEFLRQEEESCVSALREEQDRQARTISPVLERLRQQLCSLSHSIQALEEQLQRSTGNFLHSYRPTQRCTQAPQAEPLVLKELLIDEAGLLGNLGFRLWEKMKSMVPYSPVILDPNTAPFALCLSEDLTSVTFKPNKTKLPENSERFTRYPLVLGREGFSSGTHCWDVQVGDYPHWVVGVAKESINRKGEVEPSQRCGFWGFAFHNNEYHADCSTVKLQKPVEKIRVELQYDKGAVCFYDADDMSLLWTHAATFTGTVLPYFCVGPAKGNATAKGITICPNS